MTEILIQERRTMFKALLPREEGFFDNFEQMTGKVVEGVRHLASIVADYTDIEMKARRLKEIEREGDEITHATYDMLHRTFVTPLDRDEIHRLAHRLDSILDLAAGTADRLFLYNVTNLSKEFASLVSILLRATERIQEAVRLLRTLKKSEELINLCIEIHRLENESDYLSRQIVARLFREEKDALQVMKLKEIYEIVEEGVDRCEDVAEILRGILIEHA